MTGFRKVPVLAGTNLRRGGSTMGGPDHDNIIGKEFGVAAGEYTAFVQCAGQQVGPENGPHNFWWVLIETPQGTGWVNATRIDEGGNNEPIKDVTRAATVFDVDVPGGFHRKVPVVPGGGRVRRGGSTLGDQDNVIGHVNGGDTVTALVQCAGEKVDEGPKNFWWVLIETEDGVGWISAILIDEGGDNESIKDVPIAPPVFARPPDLLPEEVRRHDGLAGPTGG